jgi:hypothetical protein
MEHELADADLDAIERRLNRAFEVASPQWKVWLETRDATGGCSFVHSVVIRARTTKMCVDARLAQRQPVHQPAGSARRFGGFGDNSAEPPQMAAMLSLRFGPLLVALVERVGSVHSGWSTRGLVCAYCRR